MARWGPTVQQYFEMPAVATKDPMFSTGFELKLKQSVIDRANAMTNKEHREVLLPEIMK